MPAVRVHDLRLSFVWFKGFPASAPNPLLGGRLGNRDKYIQEFDQAKNKHPGELEQPNFGATDLVLPWRSWRPQHFWERYLEVGDLKSVDSERAWKHLMPLRSGSLAKPTKRADCRLVVEGFYYPHGVGTVASITIRTDPVAPLPLFDMVAKANALRWGTYEVTWRDDSTVAKLPLQALAAQALNRLSAIAGNEGAVVSAPLDQPFSIASVVDAKGAQVDQPITPNGRVHRALEALCTWDRFWKKANLHPLDDSTMLAHMRQKSLPGHVLYALERGRAVWFPGWFTENYADGEDLRKKLHAVGCYQRNLMFLSLQAASLLALIRGAAGILAGHQPLSTTLKGVVGKGAGALARLYGGSADSYRARSVRTQIEGSLEDLNIVRWHALGLGPLVDKKPVKGSGG